MRSYSKAAVVVLLAALWMGHDPKMLAMQSAESQTAAGQTDSSHSAGVVPVPAAGSPASAPGAAKAAFFVLAEFTQSLSVHKLKPGDLVRAQVTQDVLSHGKIIIPVDSKLVGHVTEVKSHAPDDPESRLGIVFDRVLLKHRAEVDFRGVLHALSAPAMRKSRLDEPDPMLSPGMMGMSRPYGPMPAGPVPSADRTAAGNMGSGIGIATNPAGPPPAIANGAPIGSNPGPSVTRNSGVPPAMAGEPKAMSVGTPLGVFGLKGLSLSAEATATTPGPVIVSKTGDVKLESGTQVLLRVTDATVTPPTK
jgi:hypothetical protein